MDTSIIMGSSRVCKRPTSDRRARCDYCDQQQANLRCGEFVGLRFSARRGWRAVRAVVGERWPPAQRYANHPPSSNSGKRYRPRYSVEKRHVCEHPGCLRTFYERKNLLQHQTLKHGRVSSGRQWPDRKRWLLNSTRMQCRRPRDARDKPHLCTYPNCNKAFYERQSLLRHQTLKHGRASFRRVRVSVQHQTPPLRQSTPDTNQSAQL
ncbi:hypothetical protein LSAT2_010143 [Lamellibrachia satsuma]|nr:hypothetical protein LSAT2_010143 [Lamellibrachia satsuma]